MRQLYCPCDCPFVGIAFAIVPSGEAKDMTGNPTVQVIQLRLQQVLGQQTFAVPYACAT